MYMSLITCGRHGSEAISTFDIVEDILRGNIR